MIKDIVYSTLWNKCPKCHQTNVFVSNKWYNLKEFDKMNEICSCCNLKFEKEYGFYTGAMYVSYALMVGWFVFTWVLDSFLFKSETWQYLTFVTISMTLLIPLTFRHSRLLWINFFNSYDKNASECIHKTE